MIRHFPLLHRFPAELLLPGSWRTLARPEQCYFFNPAITRHDDATLMAYRVVLPDLRRRIAVCRLDGAWKVQAGSATALSDRLVNGSDWHADPRFCWFGDRLLLHFNNGARVPNSIFLVELDPATLQPTGPCRSLRLDGPRVPVEKNWMFFAHDGELYTVYSIAPQRVFRVNLEASDAIQCVAAHATPWEDGSYRRHFGAPRGSTPPERVGDRYVSVFHSHFRKPLLRRMLTAARHRTRWDAVTYGIGCYTFEAEPPFAPRACSPDLLFAPPIRERSPRPALSTYYDSCVYPSGLVHHDGDLFISVGLHDDGCALLRIPLHDVEQGLVPVSAGVTR
jgi:hypothetical protein